jgi:broad specificity phosphatase PhoE
MRSQLERKTCIYLIRHGETEFNRLGIFRGRYEVELNERGRKQAEEIAGALAAEGIGALYAGPLARTRETAEIIGRRLGLECTVDEGFNNILLGKWQGVPKETIKRDYPEAWKQWQTAPENLVVPGGESVEDVKRRACARIEGILADPASKPVIAIVTHRSVMKVLAAAFLGAAAPYFWKFYVDNAAYSVFEHGEGGFSLINWNVTHHLSERVTEVW